MNKCHMAINWEKYTRAIADSNPLRMEGRIIKVTGIVAEANGPRIAVGSLCAITCADGNDIPAEVIGFKDKRVIVMPFGEMRGIHPGSRIVDKNIRPTVSVGEKFIGRIIDGMGNPLDDHGKIEPDCEYPIYGQVVNPMERDIIRDIIDVGIRSINAAVTMGKGQRIAIMAGSGVGKSVLMGMIAKNSAADLIVIGMIGERGREVREFIERILGTDGLKKTIVVVATSDSPALVRIRGAYLATALAEYHRDKGKDVILIMDSVTRYAMSLREVGLAAGEPPSAKGYTPSVFNQLPKLLERAGTVEGKGSITGIYNVLVEGDDMNEPISDAVRSIVDGHIVLSRSLAQRGHYPAIDVLASISRVMNDIVTKEHLQQSRELIRALSIYKEAEDLINIGAYVDGSDPQIDYAKSKITMINQFLQQDVKQKVAFDESLSELKSVVA